MNDDRMIELAMNAMVKLRRQCWKMGDDGEMVEIAPRPEQIVAVVDEALRMALSEAAEKAQEVQCADN